MLAVAEKLVVSELLKDGYDFLRPHAQPNGDGYLHGEGSISLLKRGFPLQYMRIYQGLRKIDVLIATNQRSPGKMVFQFMLRDVELEVLPHQTFSLAKGSMDFPQISLSTKNGATQVRVRAATRGRNDYSTAALLEDVRALNQFPTLTRMLMDLQDLAPTVGKQILNQEIDRIYRIQQAGFELVQCRNGFTLRPKPDDPGE